MGTEWMVTALLSLGFFLFALASPGLLLSSHEASVDDSNSYHSEQKHISFYYLLWLALHRWHQNKIAFLSELPMQILNAVSVCVRHRLLCTEMAFPVN